MARTTSSIVRITAFLLIALLAAPAQVRGGAPGTPIETPTDVATPAATSTETAVETATPLETATPVETPTPDETAQPTESATPTVEVTAVETASPSPEETPTAEDTASPAPTETPTAIDTGTPSDTGTPAETPVESATPTVAAITATPTPLGTATPTPATTALPLNHFQCYEVHVGPFTSRQVSLDDQFGDSGVRVRHPKRICNPADKRGEDPDALNDPDHLVGYPVRQQTPRFTRIRDVEVVNQFGTIFVDLVRPDQLLVPSLKSRSTPPTPATATVDHFKCYRAKGARFRAAGISVTDQFGTIIVDIKRPRRLCVPAEKNDEGAPSDPVSHLMCYEVRLASNSPRFTPAGQLFITNQFGDDSFDAFRPTELCVPSLKNPSTAPTATSTPAATLTPALTPTETPEPTPGPSPGGCQLVQSSGFEPTCDGECPIGQFCTFVPGNPGACECRTLAQLCLVGQAPAAPCGGFCRSPLRTCGVNDDNPDDIFCDCLLVQ